MTIFLREKNFDCSSELALFRQENAEAGAIVNFTGQVRSTAGETTVSHLFLEHFPGLTETGIGKIKNRAHARWYVSGSLILHRIGSVYPGETIVLVAVAADHRRDAFQAVDYIMDYLKSDALFWKKEFTDQGEHWVEPREQDYQDKQRWSA